MIELTKEEYLERIPEIVKGYENGSTNEYRVTYPNSNRVLLLTPPTKEEQLA